MARPKGRAARGKGKVPPVKKGPRQKALPGMDDRRLNDLHETAISYAEIRDQRMGLSVQEVDAKKTLLVLMKKHKKEHYQYQGVIIDIVHEKENVKVKIKVDGGEDQEDQVKQDQADFADVDESGSSDEVEEAEEGTDEYEEEEGEEVEG